MLNKYKYKNKIRYHFREKKNIMLSWEKNDNNLKFFKKDELKWKYNLIIKKKKLNSFLYKSSCKRLNLLNQKRKEINEYKNWIYNSNIFLKKKPFIGVNLNRELFWEKIIEVVNKKDSLFFIKNNLYYILDNNMTLYKNLNVLNFSWLLETKKVFNNQDTLVNSFVLSLKFFFNGFINHGFKFICEKRVLELLVLLKIYLKKVKKSSLQLLLFFFERLKPLVGFRRRRLGRARQKKKDVRYFFRLYHHNDRWRSLLLKRLIFNSPFYLNIKRTKIVNVSDIFKGLISSLENKGPITKGLVSYYKLIGKRTSRVKRKKKKKKKKKFIN